VVNHRKRKLFGDPRSGPEEAGLLNLVENGTLLVPEFQRPYQWGKSPIKTCRLLASIAQGWPAGALLLLQGDFGFENTPVKNWADDGVGGPQEDSPLAILDGQQRLTALYSAFFNKDPKWIFVVNLKEVLETGGVDHGETKDSGTFRALTHKAFKDDYADPKTRAKEGIATLEDIRDPDAWSSWQEASPFPNGELAVLREGEHLKGLLNYEFPVSTIPQEASIEALTAIFVEINQQGTPLKTFDLVTAKTLQRGGQPGVTEFNLRDKWIELSGDPAVLRREEDRPPHDEVTHSLLRKFNSTVRPRNDHGETPLKLLLLAGDSKSLSSSAMVNLPDEEVQTKFTKAARAIDETLAFLVQEIGLIPNTLANDNYLLPLAVQFYEKPNLCKKTVSGNSEKRAKLLEWYWAVTLQAYFGAGGTKDRLIRQTKELRDWIHKPRSGPPESVTSFWSSWNSSRLVAPVGDRNEHFLQAILALEVHQGATDWIGVPSVDGSDPEDFPLSLMVDRWDDSDVSLEVHHIWAEGIDPPQSTRVPKADAPDGFSIPSGDGAVDIVLNRCLLLASTNNRVDTRFLDQLGNLPGIRPANVKSYLFDPEAKTWSLFAATRIRKIEAAMRKVLPPRD
jgi:hypothetical protein